MKVPQVALFHFERVTVPRFSAMSATFECHNFILKVLQCHILVPQFHFESVTVPHFGATVPQ